MTAAVGVSPSSDRTDVPHVVRCGIRLGVLESALVAGFGVTSRALSGAAELGLEAVILLLGLVATVVLPGRWTRARTIEGIAGAAGIGLAAAGVFMVIDIALLQPVGLYTNRWLEIGGGSNWWYHPVWWMVGTYLAWMGAWVLANQAARSGEGSPPALVAGTLVLAAGFVALGIMIGVPGASVGLGSFAVGVLPALALLVAISRLRVRRS
jgi:hypothetical protein